jgi:hypothetical protein
MKLWPSWRNRIKLGDLVRFDDAKREKTRRTISGKLLPHLSHIFEIGLVIDTQGLDPIVSFPSRTQNCATSNLEVA